MAEPFVLEGTFVRLEPLSEAHVPALVVAAAEDRTNYRWTYTPESLDEMSVYVADVRPLLHPGERVAVGERAPDGPAAPAAPAEE